MIPQNSEEKIIKLFTFSEESKSKLQKVTRRDNQQDEMKRKMHSKWKDNKETINAIAEMKPLCSQGRIAVRL